MKHGVANPASAGSKALGNVASAAETGARKMGSAVKTGASKIGNAVKTGASKIGNAVQSGASKVGSNIAARGQAKASQGLANVLGKKAFGQTANKAVSTALNQGAKQVAKQGLKQGAKKALGFLGPAGAVVGAGMAGYDIGEAAMNTETGQKVSDWGSDKMRSLTGADKKEKAQISQAENQARANYKKAKTGRAGKPVTSEAGNTKFNEKAMAARGSKDAKAGFNQALGEKPKANSGMEAKKAPAENAPTAGKKRSAFGQAFDNARKLRESGKGGDTFKFKGKDGKERSYHSYNKDEMDGKGSKYKSTDKQKAAYKQKIAGKKEAPRQEQRQEQRREAGSQKLAPGQPDISRNALRRDQRAGKISSGREKKQAVREEQRKAPREEQRKAPPTRREKQNSERQRQTLDRGNRGRNQGGGFNKFGPGPGGTSRNDRDAVMANRNLKEDVIDAGNRTVTKEGNRTLTSDSFRGGKPKTMRQANMLREIADGQNRAFRGGRKSSGRQNNLGNRGINDKQMASRRSDRSRGERALYNRNKPNMENMMRSEDSSIEKLAKFVEKRDDLKKNND